MTTWLLDTGPLVAFFDRADRFHEWARQRWAEAPLPMITCDAVLAEAAYLLRTRVGIGSKNVLELFERKIIRAPFSVEQEANALADLLDNYEDQEMDLADACLVRMSEMWRDCRVFTLDLRDFSRYRRFERRVIPLVAMP